MFVILTLLFTTVLAHSHEKYIDLLPEEEKQQFLDKVARRIMETVESGEERNENKFSGELTDEQLKGHSKFVQEILRQESAMLKKRRSGIDLKAEENLKGMYLTTEKDDNSVKHDPSSDQNNANSSVKKVKRRSTEEELPENSSDYIKVHIVTETSLPMQKRSESSAGESDKKENSPKKTSKEEEFSTATSKDPETLTTDFNVHTEVPEAMESTTDSQGLITETEKNNYTPTTDTPETHYKILRATGSRHEDLNLNVKSEIIENKTQAPVNHTLTEGSSVKTDENSENYPTKSSILVKSYTNNKTSLDVSNKTTPKSIFIDLNDYSPPPTQATNLNVATTVDHYQFVTESTLSKVKVRASTPTTPILPALTPKSRQKKTNKKQKKTTVIKRSENITSISYIASEALKKVKSQYDLKNRSKNSPSYRIYEIPSPKIGNPPFLRSSEPMENSPFFVPVYRFSPNNAYYNPTNRLGPNAVEENSIELDTHHLRGGEQNVAKRPVPQEFILQLNDSIKLLKKVRKFAHYHKEVTDFSEDIPAIIPTTTIKYTYENSDSDESISSERFPNSYEKSHPMNNMEKGTKNHIQAIRNVIFKHQMYGGPGPEKKEDLVRELYGNTDILHKYDQDYKSDSEKKHYQENAGVLIDHWKKKHQKKTNLRTQNNDNDIDIDYYLGRVDDLNNKNNNDNKGLYRVPVNNNGIKQRNRDLILKYIKDKNRNNNEKKKISKQSRPKANSFSVVTNKLFSNDLQKTKDLNFKSHQNNYVVKVSVHMKALKDLINMDSKALKQYDWLATTVQIRGALSKIFQLIRNIQESKPIAPADVQLLKYISFLHNFALEMKAGEDFKIDFRRKGNMLSRKDRQLAELIMKEKNMLKIIWMRLKPLLPNLTSKNVLNEVKGFLLSVEEALEDLHEAIKNISQVTTFKHQNWWANLKQLYLTTNEKHLREILLHISFMRLLELIVRDAEKGMNNDFVSYMKTHRRESKRTFEEMMFVTKVLEEIKNSLN